MVQILKEVNFASANQNLEDKLVRANLINKVLANSKFAFSEFLCYSYGNNLLIVLQQKSGISRSFLLLC